MISKLMHSMTMCYNELARLYLLSVLEQGVKKGELVVQEGGAVRHTFGNPKTGRCIGGVAIQVKDERFWGKVLGGSDLGFAEAYMLGYVDLEDIKKVLNVYLDNRDSMTAMATPFYRLYSVLSGFKNYLLGQTLEAAHLNAIAGYDVSNDLFQAFLSEEMMYSCALWGPEEGGVRGDIEYGPSIRDLETAQLRKIHHVLMKARVRPGDRVLEFGTGWGALAIEAARTYGATVDTLTLSAEQKLLAEERIEAVGLSDKITVHLLDYRCLPDSFHKAFDAFVSIEMVEHTGAAYHTTYFSIIDWALKNDRGAAVISATTQPESRYSVCQATDFGRKYIWPKALLPSPTALITAAYKATSGKMTLESVEDHTTHYPRTLREWGRRLTAKIDSVIAPKLSEQYPELQDPRHLETFRRKWMYLFAYAEAGFSRAYATCHMLTFVRPENVSEFCD
ncbi:CFS1-like protein [Cantharellus anzutake]|uniref:CFS1-like protein n=1 Tax=Cantharellus anzutake TaxID=1750568 RepID=UPI0019035407|nr:CFS1-like protein [Cantharellus anzutake]KAF8335356.1 CFS1-like protein [Cantharellus anzutake]